jgi:hypothetical protein
MFTQAIPTGRRRALDRKKKQLFCDAVARDATMTEAAVALGVSLRTVQREARRDPGVRPPAAQLAPRDARSASPHGVARPPQLAGYRLAAGT